MYKDLMNELNNKGEFRTLTLLDNDNLGSKAILDLNNNIISVDSNKEIFENIIKEYNNLDSTISDYKDNKRFVYERCFDSPQMIILGAGHVARAFAKIATELDFNVTVVDDRKEFANKDNFPNVSNIICSDYEKAFNLIPDTYNTYYVIVTRGHKFDEFCLRKALSRNCIYVGMIGSKSKVGYVLENLKKDGFSDETIKRVHTPIGIPMPGNLPMEVAVSIAAEVTNVRHKSYTSQMDINIKNYILSNDNIDAVMATIVKKTGSSPRDVGSKMLIFRDSSIIGSVGGGNVEYQAIKTGVNITSPQLCTYNLSNEDSAKLGMVCGGTIEILFEVV